MVSMLSIFLAKVWGILLIILFLALLNKKTRENFFDIVEKERASLAGLIPLMIGIVMVTGYNVWTGWEAIITVFGWLAFIKGVAILFFPGTMSKIYRSVREGNWIYVTIIIGIIIGLFLTYVGFMAG